MPSVRLDAQLPDGCPRTPIRFHLPASARLLSRSLQVSDCRTIRLSRKCVKPSAVSSRLTKKPRLLAKPFLLTVATPTKRQRKPGRRRQKLHHFNEIKITNTSARRSRISARASSGRTKSGFVTNLSRYMASWARDATCLRLTGAETSITSKSQIAPAG